MKYKKKPEFVEAIQWTAELHNFWEIQELCDSAHYPVEWRTDDCLIIHIGCDKTYAHPGDYIVKNSVGAICGAGIDLNRRMSCMKQKMLRTRKNVKLSPLSLAGRSV